VNQEGKDRLRSSYDSLSFSGADWQQQLQLSCRTQGYDEDRAEATSLEKDSSLRIAWGEPLFGCNLFCSVLKGVHFSTVNWYNFLAHAHFVWWLKVLHMVEYSI
jgi:hypothetical protein